MKGYPLITKKQVNENRVLKEIQKEVRRNYRSVKGRIPKAQLSKLVKLRKEKNYYDLGTKKTELVVPESIDIQMILECMRRRELVGLGGAGFPTEKKLNGLLSSRAKEKVLIINAVECDPGLIHDGWLLKHKMAEIQKSAQLLKQYAGLNKVYLATKEAIPDSSAAYEVCRVPNRYPMGAERILIERVLGRSLGTDTIPAQEGILVLNVQTVYSIYEAVCEGCFLKTRFVTLADLTTGEAVVARVDIGAKVEEVMSQTLGRKSGLVTYFGEGIMKGTAADENSTVDEKTNLVAYGKSVNYEAATKCKGCGGCSRRCPMGIKVSKIIRAVEKGEYEKIPALSPEVCIQCGACTYYCRAGKNIMGIMEELKGRKR